MSGLRLYTAEEKKWFVPPPCPRDGSRVSYAWSDLETLDSGPRYSVVPAVCTNPDCELGDPETAARADWGPVWRAVTYEG